MRSWIFLAFISAAIAGCASSTGTTQSNSAITDAQYLGRTLFEDLTSSDGLEPNTSREKDLIRMIAEKDMSCAGEYKAVSTFNNGANEENLFLILSSEDGVQFGRHFRFRFKARTNDLIDITPSTKTCINVPADGDDIPYVTHLLSDTPSEFHVYLSLKHKKQIFVSAGSELWSVQNGVISKVEK